MEKFLLRMKSLLGDEYEEFLKYYEGDNFRGLRVNTIKCTSEKLKTLLDFKLENTPFCKEGFYGFIECKKSKNAPLRPGQKEFIAKMNEWSYGRICYPENWEEAKKELKEILG